MYQFFVEDAQIGKEFITITGSDVNHIKNVLRMKPGEKIRVSNQQGKDYYCKILELGDDFVQADILDSEAAGTELGAKIFLFQALPKGDRMETVIQKAVELGVYEIIPVATKRAIVKLDAKKEKSKLARWQAISEAAAKQSKRAVIPQVHSVMSFAQALAWADTLDVRLIPYEMAEDMAKTRSLIEEIRPGQSIGIFIGPEGGFAPEEIEQAMAHATQPITLGKRILRTETAGMTVLSILMYTLEGQELKA